MSPNEIDQQKTQDRQKKVILQSILTKMLAYPVFWDIIFSLHNPRTLVRFIEG